MSEDEKPTLESVLEHYDVQIKHGRTAFMTRCPLHDDMTPSLSVNTDKQVWLCHSCGQKGDSYTLIMLKEQTNFVGARTLSATLGLTTGGGGGSSEQLSGSHYGSRRKPPQGKGDRPRDGGYVPAWKRARSDAGT